MSDRKPMTKAAKKHHIKTAGQDRCPYCKKPVYGENLEDCVEYGEFDPVEDGTVQQRAKCLSCHGCWMDVWVLTEVHELCDGAL